MSDPENPETKPINHELLDVTDVDMRELIRAAYDLSKPQGLGHLHYRDEPLDDEEVDFILANQSKTGHLVLSMDYVNGRAVKLSVWREPDGRLTINGSWYDHSDEDFRTFLARIHATRKKREDPEPTPGQ